MVVTTLMNRDAMGAIIRTLVHSTFNAKHRNQCYIYKTPVRSPSEKGVLLKNHPQEGWPGSVPARSAVKDPGFAQ